MQSEPGLFSRAGGIPQPPDCPDFSCLLYEVTVHRLFDAVTPAPEDVQEMLLSAPSLFRKYWKYPFSADNPALHEARQFPADSMFPAQTGPA